MMMALGLIETKGLLAAIEGADAMLKAADVRLLEKNLVGGGLVTITVAGEVAAVKAAVEAAAASIMRIPGSCLVSRHVIPRPDDELTGILALAALPEKAAAQPPVYAAPIAKGGTDAPEQAAEPAEEHTTAARPKDATDRFKKMSMAGLRQLAQKTDGIAMDKKAIASADKKTLIEAIIAASRQSKE